MSEHVIIDGNNLLYAMHAHAPVPSVGRETLVKHIHRWAGTSNTRVTLVYDGPTPRRGLAGQMQSRWVTTVFSAPRTADDIIIDMIHNVTAAGSIRIVTSDTAIRREATHRRCRWTSSPAFVEELFAKPPRAGKIADPPPEKPTHLSPEETQQWLDEFNVDDTNLKDEFDDFGD